MQGMKTCFMLSEGNVRTLKGQAKQLTLKEHGTNTQRMELMQKTSEQGERNLGSTPCIQVRIEKDQW